MGTVKSDPGLSISKGNGAKLVSGLAGDMHNADKACIGQGPDDYRLRCSKVVAWGCT